MSSKLNCLFLLIAAAAQMPLCCSFLSPSSSMNRKLPRQSQLAASSSSNNIDDSTISCQQRRTFLGKPLIFTVGTILSTTLDNKRALAADGQLAVLLDQIKEGSKQLEAVPDLIKAEQWDGVRAILIKPPLSNMWTSGGANKLLNKYADAIGNELPDGDEIAALELREDLISHLRYLDMAVYNNVFNPIGSEGTTGATKELIRSYYEDPINEWKASKKAIDDLIGLASQKE
eukprot:CAMPEP_0201697742 /NCGR_PEP_ID=MMETSP0578-20130828/13229_1 /ASSEMBLY_ACC=CAM_ASM_000663 /TAXON_ID=267565 /ORGANISM="Skeletonema grethea, Strain CCMP 1804" /LENGTH=230 /DNA_ID=CAMNT_0048184013 /DNA_START=27 /DNA_END=717 /DNA_ORIENTATION=-